MSAPTTRNFAREMRKVIDDATAEGDYVPRQLATEIAEKLAANDPDLLAGWLDAQAEHFIWQAINDRDRSVRSHARAHRSAKAFGEAESSTGEERETKLRDFLGMRFTVADGMRKTLGSLKSVDLLFVGDEYERRETDNRFMKVLMRALAKKVGPDRSVGDLYSNEQLAAMFDGLGGH